MKMASKLKQRHTRRLKADVAWWRAEAADLHARVMEQANEIAELRRQVASLQVPAAVIQDINVKEALAMGIWRYGDAMQELAKKSLRERKESCSHDWWVESASEGQSSICLICGERKSHG